MKDCPFDTFNLQCSIHTKESYPAKVRIEQKVKKGGYEAKSKIQLPFTQTNTATFKNHCAQQRVRQHLRDSHFRAGHWWWIDHAMLVCTPPIFASTLSWWKATSHAPGSRTTPEGHTLNWMAWLRTIGERFPKVQYWAPHFWNDQFWEHTHWMDAVKVGSSFLL